MNNTNNLSNAKLRPIDREFLRLPPVSKIAKNLYIGGFPKSIPANFKAVFQHDNSGWYFVPPGVTKTTFLFEDEVTPGFLKFPIERFREVARQVNLARRQGDVLVHCAMGLNRSALIAGLALVEDGVSPKQALKMLRERRSSWALVNPNFEEILLYGREISFEKFSRLYPATAEAEAA